MRAGGRRGEGKDCYCMKECVCDEHTLRVTIRGVVRMQADERK